MNINSIMQAPCPYEIGDLCPNCSEEWDSLQAEFKRGTKDFKTGEANV